MVKDASFDRRVSFPRVDWLDFHVHYSIIAFGINKSEIVIMMNL